MRRLPFQHERTLVAFGDTKGSDKVANGMAQRRERVMLPTQPF